MEKDWQKGEEKGDIEYTEMGNFGFQKGGDPQKVPT